MYLEITLNEAGDSKMGNQPPSAAPLLTVEEVRRRGDELLDLERRVREIEARRKEIKEWMEVVERLVGAERLREIVGEFDHGPSADLRETIGGRVTWTSFLDELVRTRGGRVSYEDAKAAVKENAELGPILERTEKSFHGALGKLEAANRVKRHKGWIFTPEAYRDAVSSGELEVITGGNPRRSPMGEAILKFVGEAPTGATSREVVEHIKGIEEFHDVVERNPTNVYNILSRLVARGQLRKEGSTYFPPPHGGDEKGDTHKDVAP